MERALALFNPSSVIQKTTDLVRASFIGLTPRGLLVYHNARVDIHFYVGNASRRATLDFSTAQMNIQVINPQVPQAVLQGVNAIPAPQVQAEQIVMISPDGMFLIVGIGGDIFFFPISMIAERGGGIVTANRIIRIGLPGSLIRAHAKGPHVFFVYGNTVKVVYQINYILGIYSILAVNRLELCGLDGGKEASEPVVHMVFMDPTGGANGTPKFIRMRSDRETGFGTFKFSPGRPIHMSYSHTQGHPTDRILMQTEDDICVEFVDSDYKQRFSTNALKAELSGAEPGDPMQIFPWTLKKTVPLPGGRFWVNLYHDDENTGRCIIIDIGKSKPTFGRLSENLLDVLDCEYRAIPALDGADTIDCIPGQHPTPSKFMWATRAPNGSYTFNFVDVPHGDFLLYA